MHARVLSHSRIDPTLRRDVKNTRPCPQVRPERLSALALALRMLRLSQPEAPPTPHVTRDRKGRHMGDDSVADAMAKGGSEIPISSGAAMVLTAELLRLAGHRLQLIQLLHLDNVVRIARLTAARNPRFASQVGEAAAVGIGARKVMPLPWAYREHLCSWMMEEGQESQREVFARQVAAANSVIANSVMTLAAAPAVLDSC